MTPTATTSRLVTGWTVHRSRAPLNSVEAIARDQDVALQSYHHLGDEILALSGRLVDHGLQFPQRRIAQERQLRGVDIQLFFDLCDPADEPQSRGLRIAALHRLGTVLPGLEDRPEAFLVAERVGAVGF